MRKNKPKMTRKQAIQKAVSIIASLNYSKENNDVIEVLNEIADSLPLARWDEKTIFDAFDQFISERRLIPQKTDLNYRGLPTKTSLKNIFGMCLSEFVDTYYSEEKEQCKDNLREKYRIKYEQNSQLWLDNFKEQYSKLYNGKINNLSEEFLNTNITDKRAIRIQYINKKHLSQKDYDLLRDKHTPASQTIIKMTNAKTWTGLLDMCGFKSYYHKKRKETAELISQHCQADEQLSKELNDLFEKIQARLNSQ